jgi:regulatory protein
MKTVTKIELQKKRKDRVSIFLDGTFFCGMPQSLVSKLDLFQGKVVDEHEITWIIEKKLAEEAKQKIIRLLNRRIYSEKEIVDKLRQKGYDDRIVDSVVGELKQLLLIDDLSFARAFVSDRMRLKPEGSFKVAYELRQKGISKEIVEQVLREEQVVEGDSERALEIAGKRLATFATTMDKKTKQRRLSDYLKRRGFSFEVIRNTLDSLLS